MQYLSTESNCGKILSAYFVETQIINIQWPYWNRFIRFCLVFRWRKQLKKASWPTLKKDDSLSDDDKKRESDSVQKQLDVYIKKVDDLVKVKEEEILKI